MIFSLIWYINCFISVRLLIRPSIYPHNTRLSTLLSGFLSISIRCAFFFFFIFSIFPKHFFFSRIRLHPPLLLRFVARFHVFRQCTTHRIISSFISHIKLFISFIFLQTSQVRGIYKFFFSETLMIIMLFYLRLILTPLSIRKNLYIPAYIHISDLAHSKRYIFDKII